MIDKIYNYVLYSYLVTLTRFKTIYSNLIEIITDTEEIKSFNKKTKKTNNLIWRYYLIRLIDYLVLYLKNTRKRLDVNVDKIQIIKNFKEGQRTIILDSDMYNNNKKITITNLIKHIENINYKNISTSFTVFVKFELHDTPKEPICLKQYLVKYKDNGQFHHHTLENIISFNNLKIENSEAYIYISFFKDNMIKYLKIPFYDINKKHINDFHEPEKIINT